MQRLFTFLLPLCYGIGAIIAQPTLASDFYYPSERAWEVISPTAAGAKEPELQQALAFAQQKKSKGVVVLHRGRILAEEYWDGWTQTKPHPAYSASKSFVSTLVGIAIEQGKIKSLDQPVADILPEWKGKPRYEKISIKHLLSMSAGLEGGKRNFFRGLLARDERRFAMNLPIDAPPGTVWEYHNSAYRLFFPLLEEATEENLQEYSEQKLFEPLGMRHTKWLSKRFNRNQYTFLETTPRDAARFGLFILRKGKWQDKQLVPKDWVEQATTPANPKLNPSYGYLWWLNGGSFHYRPLRAKRRGPIFPGCPDDAFAAIGKDSQVIYIVPSLDLVVTRFGDAPDRSTPAISEFDAKFLGQICRSLESANQ